MRNMMPLVVVFIVGGYTLYPMFGTAWETVTRIIVTLAR